MPEPLHRYHFVPVSSETHPAAVSLDEFDAGRPVHVTHDRWTAGTFSGRIVCRLLVETPLVIGAKRDESVTPAKVEPFLVGGQPAIPGSTLRGLVSSVAEAASNSALRVLANREPVGEQVDWPAFDPAQGGFPGAFFGAKNPDLLPAGLLKEPPAAWAKKRLTIAEQLFGFVEESADQGRAARTLASRVRISTALPGPVQSVGPLLEPSYQSIKLLLGPNPLSAALYFRRRDGKKGYLRGKDLDPLLHEPLGRKFYLHHEGDWEGLPPKKGKDRRVQVRPIRPDAVFFFHVDFDNLSEAELGLLCYALRPTPDFRHRLGLGKPYGLGRVYLSSSGLFLIDRALRYRADPLEGARYHHVWRASEANLTKWPDTYRVEIDALGKGPPFAPGCDARAAGFRATMRRLAPDVIDSLELIGETLVDESVQYVVPSQRQQYLPPLPNRDADGQPELPRPEQ